MRAVTRALALAALAAAAGCGGAAAEQVDDDRPRRAEVAADPGAAEQPRRSGARADAPSQGPLVIPRPLLDRTLAAGPGALLAQVPLQPERGEDKKFAGFRIVSLFGDTPQVLRYGVLPGDLLVSCQGQRIVTPGDLLTVFQRLRGSDVVEVQVRRAGELKVLRWPVVPALAAPATATDR